MNKLVTNIVLILLTFTSYSFAEQPDLDLKATIDNVWLITAAALVFFMQAGFAFLEAGITRAKNSINVLMKNYTDVCFGSIGYWAIGFGLMFGINKSGVIGTDHFFLIDTDNTNFSLLLYHLIIIIASI